MKNLLIIVALLFSMQPFSQEITGKELLEKSMKYHDSDGKWETFKEALFITMETPSNVDRNSEIKINLPEQYFYVKASQGENVTEYAVHKGDCSIPFNGNANPSEEVKKKNGLSCDRANLYSNYYTYLYGLPMKIKDSGTIIDSKVARKKFKGKDYLVLKATY